MTLRHLGTIAKVPQKTLLNILKGKYPAKGLHGSWLQSLVWEVLKLRHENRRLNEQWAQRSNNIPAKTLENLYK